MAASMRAHCEAAELLAGRLGLPAGVTVALHHAFERWDGSGHPDGLESESIPLAVRIAVVARDVELWERDLGPEATTAMLEARRGQAYDPSVVRACRSAPALPESAGTEELLAAEPNPRWVPMADVDGLLEVFADFADLKCPRLLGHSRRVADLVTRGATTLGIAPDEGARVRRAALVHDLGRVAVSAAIWNKSGPFTGEEWERVRMHPYHSERILTRCPPLADIAELAGSHHERLDGSGYFRGSRAAALSLPARLLAAADAYDCAQSELPPGDGSDRDRVAAQLHAEASAGHLDQRAVSAVLGVAGHRSAGPAKRGPAGLTEREQQVLRLAAQGLTIGQMATRLNVSAKTIDRHLQNSYTKIGVTSRAAAAVFVVSHGL
jgi:HD-GYP domain-containing protein (c-di-GMP phosphodiesterase class II)